MEYTIQQQQAIKEQDAALEELLKLYDEGHRELVISGKAGTGKTQLALRVQKAIYDRMLKEDFLREIISGGAAISHGAKNILARRVGKAFKCYTIASLLSLKKTYTDLGEILFLPSTSIFSSLPISDMSIIIIDEASQISEATMNLINLKRPLDSVVIYLGDWHQTKPVDEPRRDSIIFTLPMVTLTTPFRYEGDIEELAGQIADKIDTLKSESMKELEFLKNFILESGKDYVFLRDESVFTNKFLADVKANNSLYTNILINYRKDTVQEFNDTIRSKHLGIIKNPFYPGEILICKQGTKTFKLNGTTPQKELFTHEAYEVVKVGQHEVYGTFYFNEDGNLVLESLKLYPQKRYSYLEICSFPVYNLTLKDSEGVEYKNVLILKDPEDRDYLFLKENLFKQARKFKKSEEWAKYYKLIESFASFSYGYSSHIHVTQGATYKNVYVNMKDIFSVKPITLREKLQALYTAITRASSKVVILF